MSDPQAPRRSERIKEKNTDPRIKAYWRETNLDSEENSEFILRYRAGWEKAVDDGREDAWYELYVELFSKIIERTRGYGPRPEDNITIAPQKSLVLSPWPEEELNTVEG